MSPKNKKYRRPNIPASTVPEAPPLAVGSTQTTPTPAPAAKPGPRNLSTAIPVPTAQSFMRDLAFIGLTTLVIVILMIIVYYAVPR